MKLEAGKKYTDRRGRVYGPLVANGGCFGESEGDYCWHYDGRKNYARELQADLIAEYVEPAPVESPDDWVTQDRVPARNGIDRGWFAPCVTEAPSHPWLFRSGVTAESRKHGDKMSWGDTLNVYCRRKDLPPIESPDDWVILDPVVYADHVPRVGIDQFQGWNDGWTTQESFHSKQPVGLWHTATGGNHTRCRRKDLPPVPPQKPKTRTVVLKEWLCWDDDHEDVVLLRWSSANPVVDNGNLSTFDHAVETGNTRTVEIPVT